MNRLFSLVFLVVLMFGMALPSLAFGTLDLEYSFYMNDDLWDSSVSSELIGWNLGFQEGSYLSNITYFGGYFNGDGANEGFFRFFGGSMGYIVVGDEKNYLAALFGYGRTKFDSMGYPASAVQGFFLGVQGNYYFTDNFLVSGSLISSVFGVSGTLNGADFDGDPIYNLAELKGKYLLSDEWGVYMAYHWGQLKMPGYFNEILSSTALGVSYSF